MNTTLDHVSNPNITTSPVATKPSPLLLDRVSGGASGATKGTLGQGEGSILPLPPKTPDRLEQKISRRPKATRDMLNLMLEDGLPYHVIIDELAEAGRGLTPQSFTQWLKSGYEDYLKNREKIDEAKTQAEFAADVVRELGDIDISTIHRACLVLTSVQIFNAIDEYGEEALRTMLQTKHASFLTLLNTLCNTVQPIIALENHRLASKTRAIDHQAPGPATATSQ